MVELTLALTWEPPKALLAGLAEFRQRHHIAVGVQVLEKDRERQQLADFAVFGTGPDVAEVGTSWLGSLISMNALRPFSQWEVDAFERGGAFFSPVWRAGVDRGAVLAIPWRTDTRVIYYRRDMLRQAGVDEATAFATTGDLQRTLLRLAGARAGSGGEPGILPCAIPTRYHPMVLHILAPWVWQAGGLLVRDDGKKTLFAQQPALAGIVDYFRTFAPVLRERAPAAGMSDSDACQAFLFGRAAVIITGHWLLDLARDPGGMDPEVAANLGLALTPGAQYRGGMSLIIWNHSHQAREALALIRFLTSPDFQTGALRQAQYLPARQQALLAAPFSTDPLYRVISQSLQQGRGFAAPYMWGLVEDRLSRTIAELWQQILAEPGLDLEEAVTTSLTALAAWLDRTLSPPA